MGKEAETAWERSSDVAGPSPGAISAGPRLGRLGTCLDGIKAATGDFVGEWCGSAWDRRGFHCCNMSEDAPAWRL